MKSMTKKLLLSTACFVLSAATFYGGVKISIFFLALPIMGAATVGMVVSGAGVVASAFILFDEWRYDVDNKFINWLNRDD